MDSFFINPLSIVFLPAIDEKNSYETIACDWNKEEFIKINSLGYRILKAIDDNPGISLLQLSKFLHQDELKLEKFLREMRERHVVFTQPNED